MIPDDPLDTNRRQERTASLGDSDVHELRFGNWASRGSGGSRADGLSFIGLRAEVYDPAIDRARVGAAQAVTLQCSPLGDGWFPPQASIKQVSAFRSALRILAKHGLAHPYRGMSRARGMYQGAGALHHAEILLDFQRAQED